MDIRNSSKWSPPSPAPLLWAAAGCGIAFLARLALQGVLGGQLPLLFFVINCLAIAFFFGFWPALAALLASIPIALFSFVQPVFQFNGLDLPDILAASSAFLITVVAAGLIEWLRRSLYRAELHSRVSESRYRMLVSSDQDRRHAVATGGSVAAASVNAGDDTHAVVMLHGLHGSPAELGSIPRMFERIGYTVSVLQIDGYTAVPGKPSLPGTWEDWCDAVQDEVNRLKASHRTVSLCGLSMGATLALAAHVRGARVQGIVALSPVLRYDGWGIQWWSGLAAIPYALGIRDWSYKEREPYGLKNHEMRRRVMRSLEAGAEVTDIGAQDIPARHLHAAKKMMAFVRGHLSHVRSPVAVIHAVDDETAAPRNAEAIVAQVSSDLRKVLWLGDSYHIITLDNEREVVANEAVRFVSSVAGVHVQDQARRRSSSMAMLRDRRERRDRPVRVRT